jgi:hypothetical protein
MGKFIAVEGKLVNVENIVAIIAYPFDDDTGNQSSILMNSRDFYNKETVEHWQKILCAEPCEHCGSYKGVHQYCPFCGRKI